MSQSEIMQLKCSEYESQIEKLENIIREQEVEMQALASRIAELGGQLRMARESRETSTNPFLRPLSR